MTEIGRVVTPPPLPVVCRCAAPVPVAHLDPNRNHWCIACGGYLGEGARFHAHGETCACRVCDWQSCVLRAQGDGRRTFSGAVLYHITVAQGYPEGAR